MPEPYKFRQLPSNSRIVSIYNELVSLRDRAIYAPLESGMQFTLDLHIPPQNRHPAARRVPTTCTTPAGSAASVVLQLKTAKATVVGVPETCLIMKIIQPSLCLLPEPDNAHWRQEYYDPLDLAHNEAWVYRMLADRHGLTIPYFFGIFDIITPSGEAAWVLVLEFIPGPTVHEIAKSSSTAAIHHFCTLGLDAARDLSLSGWFHPDIRCSNFILAGSSGSQAVVIIDLYAAEYVTPPPSLERLAMVDAKRFFAMFAGCVSYDYLGFRDWAKQNLEPVVWDHTYDPNPDENPC
ncbi:hypothetical protein C8R45DRAFT_1144560 [Mycena sanguinolenta]|nr:hypothetical protein C8R45DRAFT_1144560 [Mycena sanguinolenta]